MADTPLLNAMLGAIAPARKLSDPAWADRIRSRLRDAGYEIVPLRDVDTPVANSAPAADHDRENCPVCRAQAPAAPDVDPSTQLLPDRCPHCGQARGYRPVGLAGDPISDETWRREIANCSRRPVLRGPVDDGAVDKILAALTTWHCDRCGAEATGGLKRPGRWAEMEITTTAGAARSHLCPDCRVWVENG